MLVGQGLVASGIYGVLGGFWFLWWCSNRFGHDLEVVRKLPVHELNRDTRLMVHAWNLYNLLQTGFECVISH